MYRINKNQVLTSLVITKLIQAHQLSEVPRLINLENYYLGDTAITLRAMSDTTKPNNKLVHSYPRYITDTLTGYFMGKPVNYTSDTQDLSFMLDVYNSNNEQDENASLATDASIFGAAYELVYLNEFGEPRFKALDPKEIITIVDDTIEEQLIYVIRFYSVDDIVDGETYTVVEVYDKQTITTYKGDGQYGALTMIMEPYVHYFDEVPVVEYRNNDYYKGDFEDVITLIDAYDKVMSDSVNDFEAFTNAYLVLKGMTADADDLADMREKRTLIMDSDADVSWLIKNAPETQTENLLSQTESNIHKFSHCPNMNDESFSSNSSGVAMRYKIMGTEDLSLIKERKFKRGLQNRLRLLSTIFTLKGNPFSWTDVDIIFERNLPVSLAEDIDVLLSLSGVISHKTQLSQIPFIDDVDAELEQVKAEREELPSFYTEPALPTEEV
jgi:SPP1 family phage portal protein